jgi:predicted permease
MDQIPMLDAVLLAGIATTAGILCQFIVKPFLKPDSRWKAISTLVICCGVAAGWSYFGVQPPENVNRFAYLTLHGIYAAGLSMGAWSGGKAVLGK